MSSRTLTQKNFLPMLVELIPELEPLYREHVSFHGEAVPGIFFASLARIVSDSLKALEGEHSERVGLILEMVDQALESDDTTLKGSAQTEFVDALNDLSVRSAIVGYGMPTLNRELTARWSNEV